MQPRQAAVVAMASFIKNTSLSEYPQNFPKKFFRIKKEAYGKIFSFPVFFLDGEGKIASEGKIMPENGFL